MTFPQFDHDLPIAEEVVDILKRELPGFASHIHAETDTFRVVGAIKFGAAAGLEMFRYPVARGMTPEEAAQPFIDETRRNVIAQLGIEKMIAERVERARYEGFSNGKAEGVELGKALGRQAAIREFAEAMRLESDGDGPFDV